MKHARSISTTSLRVSSDELVYTLFHKLDRADLQELYDGTGADSAVLRAQLGLDITSKKLCRKMLDAGIILSSEDLYRAKNQNAEDIRASTAKFQEAKFSLGDSFDAEGMMREAAELKLDPTIFNKMDFRELPSPKNIYDWITGREFLAAMPFPRQLQTMLALTEEVCPHCSDMNFVKDMHLSPFLGEDGVHCRPWTMQEILERVVLLEWGVCPKCKVTYVQMLKDKSVQHCAPNELALCQGQRSGKTIESSMISSYANCRFQLLRPSPQQFFGQDHTQEFTAMFTAIDLSQSMDTLWGNYHTRVDSAPWYKNYHDWLNYHGKKIGHELYKIQETKHSWVPTLLQDRLRPPFAKSMRGRTGYGMGIDEIGMFAKEEGAVKANADEVYKCVVGSTLVPTSLGLMRAEDVVALAGDVEPESFAPHDNLTVVNHEGRHTNISHVYNGGEQECIQIRTALGHMLTGTENHRVMVLDPDLIVSWKTMSALAVGDTMAVQAVEGPWPTEKYHVRFVPTAGHVNPYRQEEPFSFDGPVGDDLARLLGYFVAEGSLHYNEEASKYNASIHVNVGHMADDVGRVFRSVFGNVTQVNLDPVQPHHQPTVCFSTGCRQKVQFLVSLLGVNKSDAKYIPECILRSPRGVVAQFLRALFEGDGSCPAHAISYCSTSRRLCSEVQSVLSNFGIVSSVSHQTRQARGDGSGYHKLPWRVTLQGIYAKKFVEHIVFISTRKIEKQVVHASRKSRTDVPFVGAAWRAALQGAASDKSPLHLVTADGDHVPHLNVRPGDRTSSISRERLTSAQYTTKLSNMKSVDPDFVRKVETLLDLPVEWVKVAATRPVGVKPVYDVSVPDGNSFCANGVVNHNSMSNSMFTLRAAANALHAKGINAPMASMICISSPWELLDKIMRLVREAPRVPTRVAFHYSTWDVNPYIFRDSPQIMAEFADDEIKALRDFGAIPPLADNPFHSNSNAVDALPSPEYTPGFVQSLKKVVGKAGDHTVYGVPMNMRPDPGYRIMTIDSGESNNSFALGLWSVIKAPPPIMSGTDGGIEYLDEEEKDIYDASKKVLDNRRLTTHGDGLVRYLRADGLIEVQPLEENDILWKVNFKRMYDLCILPIVRAFRVAALVSDRWNMSQIINGLQDEEGIRCHQYTPNWKDFREFRDKANRREIILPKLEKPYESIMQDFHEAIHDAPVLHTIVQMKTVRRVGQQVQKPKGGTDDLYRCMVLAHRFALNENPKDVAVNKDGTPYMTLLETNQRIVPGQSGQATGVVITKRDAQNTITRDAPSVSVAGVGGYQSSRGHRNRGGGGGRRGF